MWTFTIIKQDSSSCQSSFLPSSGCRHRTDCFLGCEWLFPFFLENASLAEVVVGFTLCKPLLPASKELAESHLNSQQVFCASLNVSLNSDNNYLVRMKVELKEKQSDLQLGA